MRSKPFLALAPAVVLALVAVWSTCRVVGAGAGVPDDGAWRRASELVRSRHQPGDLIVFAPGWIDPVGRMFLGDLIPVDMAARLDAGRYGVIHELSIRGARAPETRGLTPVWTGSAGGITIRRFERTPQVLVTDLVDRVGVGRAVVDGAPAAVTLAEVGFAPHRCVQVQPGPGRTATLTFPEVALGTELVGGVGLADIFKRRQVRAAADLTVSIGGVEVARARAGVDDGWVRFRAPTTPGVATVVVSARAGGADRLICVAIEARR